MCRPPFREKVFYVFSSLDHLGNEADGGGQIRRNAAGSSGVEDGLLRKTQTEERGRGRRTDHLEVFWGVGIQERRRKRA